MWSLLWGYNWYSQGCVSAFPNINTAADNYGPGGIIYLWRCCSLPSELWQRSGRWWKDLACGIVLVGRLRLLGLAWLVCLDPWLNIYPITSVTVIYFSEAVQRQSSCHLVLSPCHPVSCPVLSPCFLVHCSVFLLRQSSALMSYKYELSTYKEHDYSTVN